MKTKVLVYLFALTCLMASCRKKEATKAEKRSQQVELGKDASVFKADKDFDLSTIKTKDFYFGEVGNNSYFIIIDHTEHDRLSGRYYPVVKGSNKLKAHKFEVEHKNNEYLFCTLDTDTPIEFEISMDADHVVGWYKSAGLVSEKTHLSFEKYREPDFQVSESKRYAPNCPSGLLTFTKKVNVVYGKAKGYWTSKPFQHEKMGQVAVQSILKTASAKKKEQNLTLDLYLPNDTTVKQRPIIVLFHGGAFLVGDKAAPTSTTWCEHFASIGYITASVNYRMGFKLSKNSIQECGYEAIQDANAALRFLLAHAEEYGIDTNNFFIGGTSAGSITALGAVYMSDRDHPAFVDELGLKEKVGGFEASGNNYKRKPKIKAIANMWGAVYDLDELNGRRIPVISFHGTEDNLVPYDEGYPFADMKSKIGERLYDKMYGSKAIHNRLDSLNVINRFYPIEGGKHAPYEDNSGKPNKTYFFIQEELQKFFYKTLTRGVQIEHDKKDARIYRLNIPDVERCDWQIEGGFIIATDDNTATVLWRSDAPKRVLSAAGERTNGCAFRASIKAD